MKIPFRSCFPQSARWETIYERLQVCFTSFIIPLVVVLLLAQISSAVTISTSTTQNGGTFNNVSSALLVTHPTNNPLLTLTNGATTSNVFAVVVGNLNGDEGQLLVNGGSTLLNTSNGGSLGMFGGTELVSRGNAYLGLNTGSSGKVSVSGANSKWQNTHIAYIGNKGQGEAFVEDGGLVISQAEVGYRPGSNGLLTVTGATNTGQPSTWQTPNGFDFILARQGTGELRIENGGLVTDTGGNIAYQVGSVGTATVTGVHASGLRSTWQNSYGVIVGFEGSGDLRIEDGGLVTGLAGEIGLAASASGNVVVTGVHESGLQSTWQNSESLRIGAVGHGELHIENGGLVTSVGTSLGVSDSSTATITGVHESGLRSTLQTSEVLFVGYDHPAQLHIEDGGLVTTGLAFMTYLGRNPSGKGTVTVAGVNSSGVRSTFQNHQELVVGYFGAGELFIEDGGLVTNTIGHIGYATFTDGAIGLVKVAGVHTSGLRSTWQNSQDLLIGSNQGGNLSEGELRIESGGLVTNVNAYLGNQSLSTSVNFNWGKGTATVTGAGSEWISSGNLLLSGTSTLDQASAATGILNVSNGGTVIVGGTTKVYTKGTINLQPGGTLKTNHFDFSTGTFNFTGGTLNASGNVTGNVVVPNGGVVKGTGSFTNLSILDGGSVAPGNSPGTMNSAITNWGAGGNYLWEINSLASDGGIAGSDPGWDLWNTNALTVSATSGNPYSIVLQSLSPLNASGALLNWNPGLAQSWLIATANAGTFTGSVLDLLTVDATQFSAFNNLAGGTFSLLAANGDANLVLAFEVGALSPAVPEPNTICLLTMGLALVSCRKGSQRSFA